MIQLEQKTSPQIAKEIAERVQKRRKERHFTQEQLALRAGMSFASYKRFEQKHEIAFDSLIKIAIALDCENDFDSLFSKPHFSSIEELLASEKKCAKSP
ncbi:MAG: helix-turn-helix transcriptional regulator [Treponema sp.]|nr:helix-turn-helix transcriptional regulator [Treponema sp.]